jgi:hypothetical protein
MQAVKILCNDNLPTFRKQIQEYVRLQRQGLDEMEREFRLIDGEGAKQ